MACNCKKVNNFQDKHGEPEADSVLRKLWRYGYKAIIFVIAILLAGVITPVILFTAVYKMTFKNNETIVLPEFLSKYMR